MPSDRPPENAWRRMVLASLPQPAWLAMAGHSTEIVLSSRVRIMRNLRGFRFPHHASVDELKSILSMVVQSSDAVAKGPRLELQRHLSPTERDFLVACRLVSSDFLWSDPGRALLLDEGRQVSLMVNEEDHLRLQAVTAGWSVGTAEQIACSTLEDLGSRLEFAWSPRFGFLSASPYNCGLGVRQSALFHLIGLAHSRRLGNVLAALSGRGIVSRGLFGEASRAIGAFVQVSVTAGPKEDFSGAGAYLLEEEARARREVGLGVLEHKLEDALSLVRASRSVSLPDAMRLLAWVRWAASEKLPGVGFSHRLVDRWFTTLILRTTGDEQKADAARAAFLRGELGL